MDLHAVGPRRHGVPDLHDHGARRSQEDLPQLLHLPAQAKMRADTLARRAQRARRHLLAVPVHDRAERLGRSTAISIFRAACRWPRAIRRRRVRPCVGGRRALGCYGAASRPTRSAAYRATSSQPGNPAPNVPDRGSLRTGAGRDGYRSPSFTVNNPHRDNAHGAIRRPRARPRRNHLHVRQHGVRWRHRRRHQPRGEHDQRRAEDHQHLRRHPFRVLRRHRDAGAVLPVRRWPARS